MNVLNSYRALRCDRALRRYDTDFEITGCLTDFLADARHWCDCHGHDYVELDRVAGEHYSADPRWTPPAQLA